MTKRQKNLFMCFQKKRNSIYSLYPLEAARGLCKNTVPVWHMSPAAAIPLCPHGCAHMCGQGYDSGQYALMMETFSLGLGIIRCLVSACPGFPHILTT